MMLTIHCFFKPFEPKFTQKWITRLFHVPEIPLQPHFGLCWEQNIIQLDHATTSKLISKLLFYAYSNIALGFLQSDNQCQRDVTLFFIHFP